MPVSQSGSSYLVSYIAQTVIGTPVIGAGGTVLRTLASPGFSYSRAEIASAELRADGFTGEPRKGVVNAPASYTSELSYLTYDKLMAAFLRSSFAGGVGAMTPGIVKTFFTFDQYLQDLDLSLQAETVRVLSMAVKVPAAGMVTVDWGLLARNLIPLATAASPSLTSPTLSAAKPMAGIDAIITIAGGAQYSSIDFAATRSGGIEAVIGATLSPDVYDGPAKGSGSITGTLESLAMLTAANTDAAVTVSVKCPDATGANVTFALANVQLIDFSLPLGADKAMLFTSKFTFGGATALTITNAAS